MGHDIILEIEFKSNDLNKTVTIRQFFYELIKQLWLEQDDFDGKRPFGNSSWDSDLIVCLIKNKLVTGKIDSDGYIKSCDNKEIDKFVINNIIKPMMGIS
jgi:hypothetical protein